MNRLTASIVAALLSIMVMINSLHHGIEKDFWLDEVSEIEGILSQPYLQLFKNGPASVQYSGSPFYFFFQKAFAQVALKRERENRAGFDWKVSLRVVPAFALALGCFFTFLLLLPISTVWAFSIPLIVSNMNFALYYGAETRMYSTWFALSLMYAACFLCLLHFPKSKKFAALFILLSGLLVFNVITSFVQVGAACFLLLVLNFKKDDWLFRGKTVAIASAVSFILFYFYRAEVSQNFSLHSDMSGLLPKFFESGLLPLEGTRRFIQYLAGSSLLIGVGFFLRAQKYYRLFLYFGCFALSQAGVLIVIFLGQYMTGQYFAQRHGIFITASQAMLRAAMVTLVCWSAAELVIRWRTSWKPAVIMGLVFLAFHLNWVTWTLVKQPQFIRDILAMRKPYCHGPIWVLNQEAASAADGSFMRVYSFKETNRRRHLNECGDQFKTGKGEFVDYNPSWIYGN